MPKAPKPTPNDDETQVTLEVTPVVVPEVIDQTPKTVVEVAAPAPEAPHQFRIVDGWET